jgi:hypothetical protein
MQRLEVSCAVRLIYTSLGAEGLTIIYLFIVYLKTMTEAPNMPYIIQ